MGILIQIAQFLLSLSILVILHEAGHFTAAKIFKMRVEKFYLFFDPWFSLFKFKRGETEYGIGWLPLGGYVKISGMIDESMDKEQMQQPPQPWEFRSKPGWQRLIVMVAGVTLNFVLGIVVYCALTYNNGTATLPIKNLRYGLYCDSLASKIGFRQTDVILAVDNKPVYSFDSVITDIIFNKAHSVQVRREGKRVDIPISEDNFSLILGDAKGFIDAGIPCIVDSVPFPSGAFNAGLEKGDIIVRADTVPIHIFQDLAPVLQRFAGDNIRLVVFSGGKLKNTTAKISEDGKLGFYAMPREAFLELNNQYYTISQSIPAGFNMALSSISNIARQINILFTVKGAHKQMGGFITMGKIYSPVWDWTHFWHITAFISLMLAFFNILPIPALDGGHVLFLLYEIITGRKPGDKFLEYAQYVGMAILLTILVYANGLDIMRLFHK